MVRQVSVAAFYFVGCFVLPNASVIAQPTGTGSISGIFLDTLPTGAQPAVPTIFAWGDIPVGPHSRGAGTNDYHWGLATGGRTFLDGVEMPLNDILAVLPSDDPAFNTRVSQEISPSTNQLVFNGFDFTNQPKGETFVAGTIEYFNGVARGTSDNPATNTSVPSVDLRLTSASLDPDFVQELNERIVIVSTPNMSDENGVLIDEISADYIYFRDRPELGSFRVFEEHGTNVEVLAEFNSLDLIGFGAVGDPSVGFVSPYVTIPEPGSALLLMLCSCVCHGRWRRQGS
jgi:hypothetical protein